MNCPHCGHEINQNMGVNGPIDPTPIYVNFNNNGCNPFPGITILANAVEAPPMPFGWQNTNAAAGCNPVMTTFIKL